MDDPKPMTLEEIVEAYLQLVMKHPDKEPKLRRDQESNRWTIHGFNRAQETLREILANHGATDEIKALAEVREEGQQTPSFVVGGQNVWTA
jgi:hypothetical protein